MKRRLKLCWKELILIDYFRIFLILDNETTAIVEF